MVAIACRVTCTPKAPAKIKAYDREVQFPLYNPWQAFYSQKLLKKGETLSNQYFHAGSSTG